jgi:hypothetical protein
LFSLTLNSWRLINYMEQSLSLDANSHWNSQQVLCVLWILKAHSSVPEIPSPGPILSQVNRIQILIRYFIKIYSYVLLHMAEPPKWFFSCLSFLAKILCTLLVFPMCSIYMTCPFHPRQLVYSSNMWWRETLHYAIFSRFLLISP